LNEGEDIRVGKKKEKGRKDAMKKGG